MRITLALILLVIVISAASNQRSINPQPAAPQAARAQPAQVDNVPSPGCFVVEKFKAVVVNTCTVSPCHTLNLTGKLRNNCAMAAGAMVKITAEDSSGAVVDTFEGWPASTRNIAPKSAYSFNIGAVMPYQKSMKKFYVEVVDARTWRR